MAGAMMATTYGVLGLVGGIFVLAACSMSSAASEPVAPAESFLSFEAKMDGKCQNLSEGGKLQVMRNTHPARPIRFRLIRYFVDVRQRGRATGIAEPGGEPIKIGCTLVGGRPQRWVVERAEFTTEHNE